MILNRLPILNSLFKQKLGKFYEKIDKTPSKLFLKLNNLQSIELKYNICACTLMASIRNIDLTNTRFIYIYLLSAFKIAVN